MGRISFTAALAIAATLALTGGTVGAKPKDPGLGDRVEIRINKNSKLRTLPSGEKVPYVSFDYRCAPSPNMELVIVDGSFHQRFPDGGGAGGPSLGPANPESMRCTGRWRTNAILAEPGWEGGPPYRKGPINVSMYIIFVDYTAGVERFGQTEGTSILR